MARWQQSKVKKRNFKPRERIPPLRKRRENITTLPETPSTSFVTLRLPPEKLLHFPVASRKAVTYTKQPTTEDGDIGVNPVLQNVVEEDRPIDMPAALAPLGGESGQDSGMQAPIAAEIQGDAIPNLTNDAPAESRAPRKGKAKAAGKPAAAPNKLRIPAKSRLHTPKHRQQRKAKSILKPDPSSGIRKTLFAGRKERSVSIDPEPQVQLIDDSPPASNEENETPSSSSDSASVTSSDSDSDSDSEMSDAPPSEQQKRPPLKLSFSRKPSTQPGGIQPATVQTPAPQSATVRTPIIKLKIPGASTPAPTSGTPKSKKKKKDADTGEGTPGSKKKRKRESVAGEDDDEGGRPAPAPPGKPATLRKLTFKNAKTAAQAAANAGPKSTGPAQLLFKVKGKIPKRPLGVGYDSELEPEYENEKQEIVIGRELDPVIHEGFVLRMEPGEDCDFLRKSIEDGKAGEIFTKTAAINLRMLDTLGRRGILAIRDHKYATSLVDLPCIIEGMKSWDKKGWIKSIDICQMLLVLGRCNSEDEARNYPLPEDVDPRTYQYAHGLTAPMKWVRKRRFARTKRARVDDIEAVERRVHALLEADKAAVSTKYHLLDHDPRLDEHGYSTEMEDDEDEDAEGEIDNYFDFQPNGHGSVETPMLTETPVQEEVDQEDVDALERMFFDEDKVSAPEPAVQAHSTLQPPEIGGESSFGVTSTSATPSATAAPTPISAEAAEASSDEDEDEDGGEEDEDRDDAEKEGDENKRQAIERIEDMQNKIAEQRELLKKTTNAILKKKLARKIQDLEDDVAMMRKNAGLGGDDDDE